MERFKDNLILTKDLKETSHLKMQNRKKQAKLTCNMGKGKYQHLVIIRCLQTIKHFEAVQTHILSKSGVLQYHLNKPDIQIL